MSFCASRLSDVMDTSATPVSQPAETGVSLRAPLLCFAVPFVLCLPTWWLFCRYSPEHTRASQQLGVEHMRVHWGFYWVITFFPYTGMCFLSSLVMLVRCARHSAGARVALIPVGLSLVGILVLLFLVFTGR